MQIIVREISKMCLMFKVNLKIILIIILMPVLATIYAKSCDGSQDAVTPVSNEKSDAYDFPIKPGTKEWNESGSISELKKVTEIPDHVLKDISTKGLVETVLNYPFLHDIYIFADPERKIKDIMSNRKGFQELIKRNDAGIELIEKYKSFGQPELRNIENSAEWALNDIELILLSDSIYSKLKINNRFELAVDLLHKTEVRKELKITPSLYCLKLLVKIMVDDNYIPLIKLLEEYKTDKYEEVVYQLNPEYVKYVNLKENIMILSREYIDSNKQK